MTLCPYCLSLDMTQLKAIEFGISSFGRCEEVHLINLPALETVITSEGKRDPYVSANFRYMKNVVFRGNRLLV